METLKAVEFMASRTVRMRTRVLRPPALCSRLPRQLPVVATSISRMIGQKAAALAAMFRPLRGRLLAAGRLDESKQDVLAAITLLEVRPPQCRVAALPDPRAHARAAPTADAAQQRVSDVQPALRGGAGAERGGHAHAGEGRGRSGRLGAGA